MKFRKIISGGQTGADRGGLDAAIECGLEHGGRCPRGRRSEDGSVPARYELVETESWGYGARTRQNVIDSDATLIFTGRDLTPGSKQTIAVAQETKKLFLHLVLNEAHFGNDGRARNLIGETTGERQANLSEVLASWIENYWIEVLNVAGTRESRAIGLQGEVKTILVETIAELRRRAST